MSRVRFSLAVAWTVLSAPLASTVITAVPFPLALNVQVCFFPFRATSETTLVSEVVHTRESVLYFGSITASRSKMSPPMIPVADVRMVYCAVPALKYLPAIFTVFAGTSWAVLLTSQVAYLPLELMAVMTALPFSFPPTTTPFPSIQAMLVLEEDQESVWFEASEGVSVAVSWMLSPLCREIFFWFRDTLWTSFVPDFRSVYRRSRLSPSIWFPFAVNPPLSRTAVLVSRSPGPAIVPGLWYQIRRSVPSFRAL